MSVAIQRVWAVSWDMPTVVFTVLGVVCAGWWLMSLVGVFDLDADVDADGDGLLGDALEPLGLTDVPVLLIATIVALVGWAVSALAALNILNRTSGSVFILSAAATALLAFAAALAVLRVSGPRLAALFATELAQTGDDLVGQVVQVRSAQVTATSGYGDAPDREGVPHRIQIRDRTDRPPVVWVTGDRALIVDFDRDRRFYTIDELPSTAK